MTRTSGRTRDETVETACPITACPIPLHFYEDLVPCGPLAA